MGRVLTIDFDRVDVVDVLRVKVMTPRFCACCGRKIRVSTSAYVVNWTAPRGSWRVRHVHPQCWKERATS